MWTVAGLQTKRLPKLVFPQQGLSIREAPLSRVRRHLEGIEAPRLRAPELLQPLISDDLGTAYLAAMKVYLPPYLFSETRECVGEKHSR
jgi:hypothetical protein